MTRSRIFTRPGAWNGGSYELAVDLGPADDTKLENALTAIWSHADLNGCYLHRDREPAGQIGLRRRWVQSPQSLDELLDGHAGVANGGTQEARFQFTMVRKCERQASIGRMP